MPRLPLDLDVRSPGTARAHLRHAAGAAVPSDRLDDALLLVSETVTNAVVHGALRATLDVVLAAGRLRVEVYDDAIGRPVRRDPGRLTAEGGRGVLLLDDVADRWGVQESAEGKTVWFELNF